jgi:dolichol-phosphate mannosyltransferase
MKANRKSKVGLVIPIYNEQGVVKDTHADLRKVVDQLPQSFLFYYVDDGSTDDTVEEIRALARTDRRIRLIQLSRNFGHQAALSAGLDHAEGEVVISLDGDGQHPPEMIPRMLDLIRQGFDIVQAQRIEDDRSISFKRWTSDLFYRTINLISGTRILPGAADFRALSRPALNGLRSMHEYHRFLRGMISWMGYSSVILPYHEKKRIAGSSKYSVGKMARLASDALFSFSLAPLYIGLTAGLLFILLALTQMTWVASLWISGNTQRVVPGWSSMMAVTLIANGIIMILLGFIGIYVGYIFQEVKRRPVYLIKGETRDE